MFSRSGRKAGASSLPARAAGWTWQGWLGLSLVAICWPLNWLLPGLRTHLLFFPLWLGYILIVDALVLRRTGSSILYRSNRDFALLFLASVPAWWLFELLNLRLQNWQYLGGEEFSDVQYFLLSSLSFSTVIPAVFETAELLHSFAWIERFADRRRVTPTLGVLTGAFLAGASMLGLLLVQPYYFYPLTWLSLILLLEPICTILKRRSLLRHLGAGDWRPLVALAVGALVCGFFWELWNFYSYPKWIYCVPGVGVAHIFEMPALGYLGYLPFGLELYPFVHLLLPSPPFLGLGAVRDRLDGAKTPLGQADPRMPFRVGE